MKQKYGLKITYLGKVFESTCENYTQMYKDFNMYIQKSDFSLSEKEKILIIFDNNVRSILDKSQRYCFPIKVNDIVLGITVFGITI